MFHIIEPKSYPFSKPVAAKTSAQQLAHLKGISIYVYKYNSITDTKSKVSLLMCPLMLFKYSMDLFMISIDIYRKK